MRLRGLLLVRWDEVFKGDGGGSEPLNVIRQPHFSGRKR